MNPNIPFLWDSCLKFWGQREMVEFWLLTNAYFQLHISFLHSLIKENICEAQASPRSLAVCAFTQSLGCGFLCPALSVCFTSFLSHLSPITLYLKFIKCYVYWWHIFCSHKYELILLLLVHCQLSEVPGGTRGIFTWPVSIWNKTVPFFSLILCILVLTIRNLP